MPARQLSHPVAPVDAWNLPAVHGAQALARAAEYRPAGHETQPVAPGAPWNSPAGQSMQALALDAAEYMLAEQAAQLAEAEAPVAAK